MEPSWVRGRGGPEAVQNSRLLPLRLRLTNDLVADLVLVLVAVVFSHLSPSPSLSLLFSEGIDAGDGNYLWNGTPTQTCR